VGYKNVGNWKKNDVSDKRNPAAKAGYIFLMIGLNALEYTST
jgi:hypothetical protein